MGWVRSLVKGGFVDVDKNFRLQINYLVSMYKLTMNTQYNVNKNRMQ